MRVAVFSDVHGNLTALEAVLRDIEGQGVDTAVFAGDLCLVGAQPAACVARLQAWSGLALYGNTDDWVLGRQEPPERLQALADWTAAQLDEGQRAWLATLPFAQRLNPTTDPADSLLVVHANPLDVNQIIFPPEPEQQVRYGRMRQPDRDLGPLLAGTTAAILSFGHLHVPFERAWGGLRLVNISSVSMPGDGDPRAKYGLFTWSGDGWSFARRYVAYDTGRERAAYLRHQPPGWEDFAGQIATEGVVAQRV